MGDYGLLLERAGATVLAFKAFGSYQGDWFAKVEWMRPGDFTPQVLWVTGAFGSCSHCDAFEAEFGYGCDCEDRDYRTDECADVTKAPCVARREAMAKAGLNYLNNAMTPAEVLAEWTRKVEGPREEWEWVDEEDAQVLAFLKENM